MRSISRLPLALALSSLVFLGAGCISFSAGGSGKGLDGGLFRSGDRGETWQQRIDVPATGGQQRSIGGVDIATIVQDPSDAAALYIGTTENGMFYSYDGGATWQQSAQIARGRIASIAVDPAHKCTVLLTAENKLLKTDDCSRSWKVAYTDARPERKTTAVLIDDFNPRIVWLSTDSGDVLKSEDGGTSWTSMNDFKNPVLKMAMHNADSRRLIVATKSSGLWRTNDGGATWQDLRDGYKQFSGAAEFTDMALGASDANVIVLASKYGLIRSNDFGDSWFGVDLVTPPGSTLIYSVGIDPKDANGLYYGTSTTFYRSPNGGVNWVPKSLPTMRTATVLLVDRTDSNVLYMGVTRFKN
jgi:photosystem II stability/assembly factor-like uncharacterized protein